MESLIDEGRRLGNTYLFGVATVWRGQIRFRQGNLEEAETDFRLVSEIIRQISPSHPDLSFPNTFLADVLIERGRLDEAEETLAAVAPTSSGHERWFLETRGRLRTAQGRLEAAVEDLSRFQPLSDRFRGPCFLPWRSSLALAFHEMGQHQEAGQLAVEEVELARRQGVPRALGVSLRTLGTVSQRVEEAEQHLEEAVQILEGTSADLESAKALYELGSVIRRDRRPKDARQPLRRALDLAERCGATRLAEVARGELGAAGARPRRVATTGLDALTPSEKRVAQLAAKGLSNRMVAQALFISSWTVAAHLTSVYQKLAISGRAELGRHLEERL
jgi:ATP/maltotriose-dependent transcriptional regulator MalT